MIIDKKLYDKRGLVKNIFFFLKNAISLVFRRKSLLIKSDLDNVNLFPKLTLDDEKLKCTACMKCSIICPVSCIHINTEKKNGENTLQSFNIETLRCISCGECESICEFEAIKLVDRKILSDHEEAEWLWNDKKLSEY